MKPPRTILFIFISITALTGFTIAQAGGEHMVQGECQPVFESDICTWGNMSGERLVSFGATVPVATAENAELEGEFVFPPVYMARIPVPEQVKEQTGIDHLGINWEVMGHPPGPFFAPHFDFHFYTESTADVDAIDCSDVGKPDELPAGYELPDITIPDMGTLVGLCVPKMGMHALSEKELNSSELFEATMVVGYYASKVIFIEPMITRDKLLERESFTIEVPSMNAPGEGMSWPSAFEAVFDADTGAYRFIFSVASAD